MQGGEPPGTQLSTRIGEIVVRVSGRSQEIAEVRCSLPQGWESLASDGVIENPCKRSHPDNHACRSPPPWTARRGLLNASAGPASEGSTERSVLSCRQRLLRPGRATALRGLFGRTSGRSSYGTQEAAGPGAYASGASL